MAHASFRPVAAVMIMISLSAMAVHVMGKEFNVGDAKGWSLGVSGWGKDRSFYLGDVLIFKYDPKKHNVLEVSTKEYETCKLADDIPNRRNFTSGHDYVMLTGSATSFISSVPGDCERGMKIHISMQD